MAKKNFDTARHHFDDIELRKWCIIQATAWPMFGQSSDEQKEVDLVNRAERIRQWVESEDASTDNSDA